MSSCFLELVSVAANLSSSSWLVALRLLDLNFAVDEVEKESPCDGPDLDFAIFSSSGEVGILDDGSSTSGSGGKPFSRQTGLDPRHL